MTDALKNRHLCHSTQPEGVLGGRGKRFHQLCNYVNATLPNYNLSFQGAFDFHFSFQMKLASN